MPPQQRPRKPRRLVTASDLAHARTRAYQRALDRARRALHAMPANTVVLVSWGKDSSVLLHLVREERPDLPIVHCRNTGPERPDGLDTARDQALQRYKLRPHLPEWEQIDLWRRWARLPDAKPLAPARQTAEREAAPAPGRTGSVSERSAPPAASPAATASPGPRHPSFAMGSAHTASYTQHATPYLEIPFESPTHAWARTNTIFAEPQTPEQRAALNEVIDRNHANWLAALHDLGCDHTCGAMRATESRRRRWAFVAHGEHWQASTRYDDRPSHHPLAWWQPRDIWAHIAVHELPLPPHYEWAVMHGWDRNRVRSEPNFHAVAWTPEQAAFWRQADPALWARLKTLFPGFHPDMLMRERTVTRSLDQQQRLRRLTRRRLP